MNKLKRCPFCGGKAEVQVGFTEEIKRTYEMFNIEVPEFDEEYFRTNKESPIMCLRCRRLYCMTPEVWNNRPLEDKLREKIKEIK